MDEEEIETGLESCMLMEVTELNPSTPADQSDSSASTSTTRPSSTLPIPSRRLTSKSYSIRTRSSSKHKSHDQHSSTTTSEQSSAGGGHARHSHHHSHHHHHHEMTNSRESRSGGAAVGDDDDQKTVTVVYARNDTFVSGQDICASCGSFGSSDVEKKLIACVQCGNCYHIFCAHPSQQYALPVSDDLQPKVNAIVSKWGWRCLECTVCEGCGEPHDEARLILCEDCDISYHLYCMKPPLKEVPSEAWRCDRCAHCQFCGSRQVSCKINCRTKVGENYTACKRCTSLFVCSYCKKNYTEGTPLMHCSTCRQWMHQECFNESHKSLSYDELQQLIDAALTNSDEKSLTCSQCVKGNKRARSVSGDILNDGFDAENEENRPPAKAVKSGDQHSPRAGSVENDDAKRLLDVKAEEFDEDAERKNEAMWPLILAREPRDLLSHDGMFLTERGYVMFKERERYLYNVTHGIHMNGAGVGGRGGKAARGRRKRGAGAPSLPGGPGSIGEHRGSDASSVSSGGAGGKRGRGAGGRGSRGPRKNCKVGVGGFSARLWSNKTRGRLARLSNSDVVVASASSASRGSGNIGPHLSQHVSYSATAADGGAGGGGDTNDDFLQAFASKDSQGDVFIDINNAENQPRGRQSTRANVQGLRHQYPTFIVDAFFTATAKQRPSALASTAENEFPDADTLSQSELLRAGVVDDSVFNDDDAGKKKSSNKPPLTLDIPAQTNLAAEGGRVTPPVEQQQQQRQVAGDADDLQRSRGSKSSFHPPTLAQYVFTQKNDLLRDVWTSTTSRAESRLVSIRANFAASAAANATAGDMDTDDIAEGFSAAVPAGSGQVTPPVPELRPESSAGIGSKIDMHDDLATMLDQTTPGTSGAAGAAGGGVDHADADANLHGMVLPDDLDDLALDEDDLMALFDSNAHEFSDALEGVDMESLNVEAALTAAAPTSSSAASGSFQQQQQHQRREHSTDAGVETHQLKREHRRNSSVDDDEKPPALTVKREGSLASDDRQRHQHVESSAQAAANVDDNTLETLMDQFDIQSALGRNNAELSNLVELSGSDADDLFKNLCALDEPAAGGSSGNTMQHSHSTSSFSSLSGVGRSGPATALIPPPQLGMHPAGVGIGGVQPPVIASSPSTALLESSIMPPSIVAGGSQQQLVYHQQQQQHSMQYTIQNQQQQQHIQSDQPHQQFQVVQQRTSFVGNNGGPQHMNQQQQQYGQLPQQHKMHLPSGMPHQQQLQAGMVHQQQQQQIPGGVRMQIQSQFTDEYGVVTSQQYAPHFQQQQHAAGGNVIRTIITGGSMPDQSPVMVMPPNMYSHHQQQAPPHQHHFGAQQQTAMQAHVMQSGLPNESQQHQQQLLHQQSMVQHTASAAAVAGMQQQSLTSPTIEQPPSSSSQQPPTEPGYQQKQLHKWGIDEARGEDAICGPVLWANKVHPEWKHEFPQWSDRNKHIMKCWKELNDKAIKERFVKDARDNRSKQKAAEKLAEKQKGKAGKKQKQAAASTSTTAEDAGGDDETGNSKDDKDDGDDDAIANSESGSTSKAASSSTVNNRLATPVSTLTAPTERATPAPTMPPVVAGMPQPQQHHHMGGPGSLHPQQHMVPGTPLPPPQSPSHHPSMSPYSQKSTTPHSFTYPPPSVSSSTSSGFVQGGMESSGLGGVPPGMMRPGYHQNPRFGLVQQPGIGIAGERELSFEMQQQQQQQQPRQMMSEGYQSGPPTPYGAVPMSPHSSSQQFSQQMRYARAPVPGATMSVPYGVPSQQVQQQQQLRLAQQQQLQQQQQLRYGNIQQQSPQPNSPFPGQPRQPGMLIGPGGMPMRPPGSEAAGMTPQQHIGSPEYNMVRGAPYSQNRPPYVGGLQQQSQQMQHPQQQQQYVHQQQQFIAGRTRDGIIVQPPFRPGGDVMQQPQRWSNNQQQPTTQQQYNSMQMQDPNFAYYRAQLPQSQQQQQWQYSNADPAQGMRPRIPQQHGLPPQQQQLMQQQARMQQQQQQQQQLTQGVYGPTVRVAYGPPPPSPSGHSAQQQGMPPQMQMQYAAGQPGGIGPRPSAPFMPQQQQQVPPGTRFMMPQQAQQMMQGQQRVGVAVAGQYYPAVPHQASQSPQPIVQHQQQQQHMQQLQQQRANNFNATGTPTSPSISHSQFTSASSGSGSQSAAAARDTTPSSQTSQPLSAPTATATTAGTTSSSPPPPPAEVAKKLDELAEMTKLLVEWGDQIDAARKEKKTLASAARKRTQKDEELPEEDKKTLDDLKKKVQSLQKRIEGKRKKFKGVNALLPPEYQKLLPQTAAGTKAAANAAAKEAAAATAAGETSQQEQSSDAAGPAASPGSSSTAPSTTPAIASLLPQHSSASPTVNLPPDTVLYQQQQQGRLRMSGLPQQIPGMVNMPGASGAGGMMLVNAAGGPSPAARLSGSSSSPFALQPVTSIPSSRVPPGSFRVPMQPPQGLPMGMSPQMMNQQMPPGVNAFSPNACIAMQQQHRGPPPPYQQQQMMSRAQQQQYAGMPGGSLGPYGSANLVPRTMDMQHQQQQHHLGGAQHSGGVMSTVMRQAGFAPDQQLAFAPICATVASGMPLGGNGMLTNMQGGGSCVTTNVSMQAMSGSASGSGGGREKNPMLKQLLEQSAAATQAAAAAAAAAASGGSEGKTSTPAATGESSGESRPSLKRKASASLSISSATATSDADPIMSTGERPQSGAGITVESLARQLLRTSLPLQEPSMSTALNQRSQSTVANAETLFDLHKSTLYKSVIAVESLIEPKKGIVSSEDNEATAAGARVKSEAEVDVKSPGKTQSADVKTQFAQNCVYSVLAGVEAVVVAPTKTARRRVRTTGYNSLLMPDSRDVPSIILGDDISLSGGYVSSIGTNSTQAQMQIDQLVQQRRTEKLFGNANAMDEQHAQAEPLCHRQLPFAAIMCEKLLNAASLSGCVISETNVAVNVIKPAAAPRRQRGSMDKRAASSSVPIKTEDEETISMESSDAGNGAGVACVQSESGNDVSTFSAEITAVDIAMDIVDGIDEDGSALVGPKSEAVAVEKHSLTIDVVADMASSGAMPTKELIDGKTNADLGNSETAENLGDEIVSASNELAATAKTYFSPFLLESETRMTVPEYMLHSPVAFFSTSDDNACIEPVAINKFYGIADLQFDPQALDAYGELREPSASTFDRRRKPSIGHNKASESGNKHDSNDIKNEPFMSGFPSQQPPVDPTRTRIRLVITRESSTRLDFVLENLAAVLDADKLWFKSLQVNKRFDMREFLKPFAVNYAVLTNNPPPASQNLLVDNQDINDNNKIDDYNVCAECGIVCLNPVVLAKCLPAEHHQPVPHMMTPISPPSSSQQSTGGGGSDIANNGDGLPDDLAHNNNHRMSRSSSIDSSMQAPQQLRDNVFCSSSCFVRYNSSAHGKSAAEIAELNGAAAATATADDDVPAVSGDMKSTSDEEPNNDAERNKTADAELVRTESLLSLAVTDGDLQQQQIDLFATAEQRNLQFLREVLLKARRQQPYNARKHGQVLIRFTTRDLKALKNQLNVFRADMIERDPHNSLLYDVGLRANRNLDADATAGDENVSSVVVVDRRMCVLCGGMGDADPQQAGRLLYYEPNSWVHSNCALWSNDVYETVAGSLMSVVKAVSTSAKRLCVSCTRSNASLQCLYPKCMRTYHFPCALREKCSFFEDKSFMCPPHWLVLSQFKMMISQIRASTGVTEDIIQTSEIIGHLAAGSAASGVGGAGSIGSGAASSTAMNAAVVAVQAAVAAHIAARLARLGNNNAAGSGSSIKPPPSLMPPIDASAAVQQIEAVMREYSYEEQQFLQLMSGVVQLEHFACFRRLHVLHKEPTHIDRILPPEHDGLFTFRTGSLLVHKIGSLMPEQVANFHTADCIYPIGYLASRMYWSTRKFNRRCRYICHIRVFHDDDGIGGVEEVPDFVVEIVEPPFPNCFIVGESTQSVCGKIFERILATRLSSSTATSATPFVKFFSNIANGDEFFGLRDAHVVRLFESLPNVLEHAVHYKARTPQSKRGQIDLPVAQNRFNATRYCSYVAPAMRHVMRNGALQLTASAAARAAVSAAGADALDSGNVKPRSAWARAQGPVRSLSCVEAAERNSHHRSGGHHRASGLASASSADLLASGSSSGSAATGSGEVDVPAYYTKQSSQAKSSQYRKLRADWQKNIYLGRSKISGLGLFAGRDIEKNTMVIEYIGQIIRHEVANRRERNYTKQQRQDLYMFRLDDSWVIDATSLGGAARYINHSCSPNCATEVVQVAPEVKKIVISSTRKILKDEELTYDYKFDVEEDDGKKIPCMCGSTACRGWMN